MYVGLSVGRDSSVYTGWLTFENTDQRVVIGIVSSEIDSNTEQSTLISTAEAADAD